jgi:hypothetical protein
MTSDKIEGSRFGWGDSVRINPSAPERFRPDQSGSVCGGFRVLSEQTAKSVGEPLGALLLIVEYGAGSDAHVPERFVIAEPSY